MAISRFAGNYNAIDFAYGNVGGSGAPALQVTSGSTSTGTYTLTCRPQTPYTSAGIAIPISTATPITIGGDSQQETITPSAVSTDSLNNLLITGTFTYAHGTGAQVSSGTYGLEEALLAASKAGGGTVTVDAAWFRAGGTQAIIAAQTQYSGVSVVNNGGTVASATETVTVALTNAQILAMGTTTVQLLPTPDANSAYFILAAILVNKNTGTAYAAGGAIEVAYGSALTTQALSGTIAATFLTTPTVTQVITLVGATPLASSTFSTYAGKGIYIGNATANFTTGTGTLEVTLQYVKVST